MAERQVNGIVLSESLSESLGGTPEEAAKVFMRAASHGLAQVIADALAQAVGNAVGDTAGGLPDWTKLIKGCMLDLHWETPPGTPLQTLNSFASNASVGGDALGAVSVSIGISASF